MASSPNESAGSVKSDGGNGGDPVVLRIPVFVNPPDPGRSLCLFQYPLRPRWRPYHLDDLKAAKCRPQQRQIELTLGNPPSSQSSAEALDPEVMESPLKHTQLASTIAATKTSYAIGMLHTDQATGVPAALCLTPLDAAVQLRPSFAQIDQAAAAAAAAAAERAGAGAGVAVSASHAGAGADDADIADGTYGDGVDIGDEDEEDAADDEGTGEEGGAEGSAASAISIAPQFRPAQTEREIEARRSSHAYLVEQREAEPWSDATLHPASSETSRAVCASCFQAPLPAS